MFTHRTLKTALNCSNYIFLRFRGERLRLTGLENYPGKCTVSFDSCQSGGASLHLLSPILGEKEGLGYREASRNKAKNGGPLEGEGVDYQSRREWLGGGKKEALGVKVMGQFKGHGVWGPRLVVKYCGRGLGRRAEQGFQVVF